MKNYLVFVLPFLFLNFNAEASDYCGDVLNQEKLINCLGDEHEKVDKELNLVYSQLRKKLSTSAKLKLKEAQRSWLIYLDKDCSFQSDAAKGGQVEQPLYISCQIEKTKIRTEELKNITY